MMSLGALRPPLPRKVGALRGGPNGPSSTPAADAQMCWGLSKVEQWQPRSVRSPGSREESPGCERVFRGCERECVPWRRSILAPRAWPSRESVGALPVPRGRSCVGLSGRHGTTRGRTHALRRGAAWPARRTRSHESHAKRIDHARRAWHVTAVNRDS